MNQKENKAEFPGNQNANLQGNTPSKEENQHATQRKGDNNNNDDPLITSIIESSYGYGTGTPIKLEGEMTDDYGNRVSMRIMGDISLDTTDPSYIQNGQFDPYGSGLHIKITRGKIKFKR